MLVPCRPYGSGSVLFDFARLIQMIPTGLRGPAARYCSIESPAAGGEAEGSGLATSLPGEGFLTSSGLNSCEVTSRGRGIASRTVHVPRPCRPGRAGDKGNRAISFPP